MSDKMGVQFIYHNGIATAGMFDPVAVQVPIDLWEAMKKAGADIERLRAENEDLTDRLEHVMVLDPDVAREAAVQRAQEAEAEVERLRGRLQTWQLLALQRQRDIERLRKVELELEAERRRDAPDGQAALDECNNEIGRLRVKNEMLREHNEHQRERIVYLEGATNHATGTPLSKARDRAQLSESKLERLHSLLRDVSLSAVEFEDERCSYVAVQIDRETWEQIKVSVE